MGYVLESKTVAILALMILGIVGRSRYVACAAAVLLVIHMSDIDPAFDFLEKYSLDIGIVFLLLSVLTPVASGKVTIASIAKTLLSTTGVCAVTGGILATLLNGKGISLLQADQRVVAGLLVGNVIGVLALGGIPVGPVAAGGIAAILIGAMERVKR